MIVEHCFRCSLISTLSQSLYEYLDIGCPPLHFLPEKVLVSRTVRMSVFLKILLGNIFLWLSLYFHIIFSYVILYLSFQNLVSNLHIISGSWNHLCTYLLCFISNPLGQPSAELSFAYIYSHWFGVSALQQRFWVDSLCFEYILKPLCCLC